MLRYEWVDVGVLDYNPANKLYYVKRVHVPNHILQAKSAEEFNSDKKEEKSKESGVKLEGEAGGASDGEQIAPQPKLSMQQVYTVMNHIGQLSFPFTVPVACGRDTLCVATNHVFSVHVTVCRLLIRRMPPRTVTGTSKPSQSRGTVSSTGCLE